jgi:hypothetical protein
MKSDTALAVQEDPRSTALQVVDLGEDVGAGTEDMRSEELLTPILRILQKGSPEVDPAQPEYNEDLRAGMWYNTATQEAYPGKSGIEVVVCARDYHYGMWVPRDLGGGFRGMLRPDDPVVRRLLAQHGRFKKLPHVIDDDDRSQHVELVETIQLYVLYAEGGLTDQNAQRAIVTFTSSALPIAQAYLTRHNNWKYRQPNGEARPAQLWSYRWCLSTVPMQNAKGSWFNPKLDLVPVGARPVEALIPRSDPLFELGRAFYLQQRAGEVKADYATASGDDEVPF